MVHSSSSPFSVCLYNLVVSVNLLHLNPLGPYPHILYDGVSLSHGLILAHQHRWWILETVPTNHLNNPTSSHCNLRLLQMVCTCMCVWVCYQQRGPIRHPLIYFLVGWGLCGVDIGACLLRIGIIGYCLIAFHYVCVYYAYTHIDWFK